jgi:hypothetical protein
VLAVAHEQFKQMDIKQVRALGKPDSVIDFLEAAYKLKG